MVLIGSMSSVAYTQDAGKITEIHVVTPSWEKQTYEDGSGLFFDIIRAVYEPVGINLKFDIVPWERAKMITDSKDADARLVVWESGEADQLIPRYPMYVDYTALVCKKDSIPTWEGVKFLEGRSVIWMRGYDNHKLPILQGMKYEWFEIDSYDQAWEMLKADRVDCYMEALIDLKPYVEQHKIDLSAYYVDETVNSANAYLEFAHTERSKQLIQIYDERMPKLLESGEIKQLFKKWDIKFEGFEPRPD